MKIDEKAGLQLLMDIILNKRRHEYYDRVCDLALKYKRIITGEDMGPLMQQFSPREDTAMFDQRKRITKHITSTVSRNLMKPQYKVPRANNIQRILQYRDDNGQQRANEMEGLLGGFFGNYSLDWYMNNRWIELNNIDPNAFIVVEFSDFDPAKETATPYPFEVSSEQALDYLYENNILQYLCVKTASKDRIPSSGGVSIRDVDKYTLYLPDIDMVLTNTKNEQVVQLALEDGRITQVSVNNLFYNVVRLGGDNYVLTVHTHNLPFVRAIMAGYYRDLYTKGITRLSAIDDAMPILEKMVKANSELDLTMALHAFPQKVQSVRKCQQENCNKGEMPDGSECPRCHGEGLEVHKTAQDIILLPLPRNREEAIDIDNVIRYISPPVDLVKFQDEYIKSLTRQCKEAIYNAQLFSREEIAQTATGKNIDLQNVYDALYPLALGYSYGWRFFVRTCAVIVSRDKGLIADFIFNKDFKMKSLNDLYQDYKVLYDSGADDFVKQEVMNDIARILYADDPHAYYRYKTKQAFYPFEGKTKEQVAVILAGNLVSEDVKVLWANFGFIFDEIAQQQAGQGIDFYLLNKIRQTELVDAKVAEIKKGLKPTMTTNGGLNPAEPAN